MASILRQIVAGPRSRHPEAGLDLCYVTDYIVVTSGPSSTYPQRAYRNPTDELVRWLDYKHGKDWSIWEFRAEGTGYPDSEVYDRIRHYPWPDHHPPPFQLIPNIMASMRNWLKDSEPQKSKRVVVVHCKAGKGRSGTIACSYLVSQEGWNKEDALERFTTRRMRAGFGPGVSIPSQLRWVNYVDTWTKIGKVYVERPIEILEIHVWGLREGVKVAVEGYIEDGRKIKTIHTFKKEERLIVDATIPSSSPLSSGTPTSSNPLSSPTPTSSKSDLLRHPIQSTASLTTSNHSNGTPKSPDSSTNPIKNTILDGTPIIDTTSQPLTSASSLSRSTTEMGGKALIFRPSPSTHIIVPTSDICIDLERRNRAPYGWTMVTAVAHVWFNAFFEGLSPWKAAQSDPSAAQSADNGVFNIEWDAMDGLKGSSKKGTRALDRLAVVWKAVDPGVVKEKREKVVLPEAVMGVPAQQVITQPGPGEEVPETRAADWKGGDAEEEVTVDKKLGMRVQSPASKNVSRASSVRDADEGRKSGESKMGGKDYEEEMTKVKTHGLDEEEVQ